MEFSILSISEIAADIAEKYSEFEQTNVYTTLHKIINGSNNLLQKPSPGNVCVNYEALEFPGKKKPFSRSLEYQRFIQSMEETWKYFEILIDSLEKENESVLLITEMDKKFISDQWKSLSDARHHIKIHGLN